MKIVQVNPLNILNISNKNNCEKLKYAKVKHLTLSKKSFNKQIREKSNPFNSPFGLLRPT